MNDAEWEEMADLAVEELNADVNHTEHTIQAAHALIEKLQSTAYIISHLDETLPENMTHCHEVNAEISQWLQQMTEAMETGKLKGTQISEEEKYIRRQLEADTAHKDWRAVKHDVNEMQDARTELVRLDKKTACRYTQGTT